MKFLNLLILFSISLMNFSFAQTPPASKTTEIFKVVEQFPHFPGCEEITNQKAKKGCSQEKMLQYLFENLNYPVVARTNGVEGTVVITFVVEKDGSISNAEILREIGAGCGTEALRVVNTMPKWNPGKQEGKPVRVQFNIPVRFKLEGRKERKKRKRRERKMLKNKN